MVVIVTALVLAVAADGIMTSAREMVSGEKRVALAVLAVRTQQDVGVNSGYVTGRTLRASVGARRRRARECCGAEASLASYGAARRPAPRRPLLACRPAC